MDDLVSMGFVTFEAEKKSGIYKIYNMVNGKYYVGSSINIPSRWLIHKQSLKSNRHHNILLQRSWNKHGESNFQFALIESLPIVALKSREQHYLNIAKSEPSKSYNLSFDSEAPNRGKVFTDEHKRKISLSQIGRKHSQETRDKLSKATKGKKRTFSIQHWINFQTAARLNTRHHDPILYVFENVSTKEIFEGTRVELSRKHNLKKADTLRLISGRCKKSKGWRLLGKSFANN